MNSGINALGQGNRANATIGRALNLIVQNVGGGRPGESDRATLGAPSKFTLCFAEDESDPREHLRRVEQPADQVSQTAESGHPPDQRRGDRPPGSHPGPCVTAGVILGGHGRHSICGTPGNVKAAQALFPQVRGHFLVSL